MSGSCYRLRRPCDVGRQRGSGCPPCRDRPRRRALNGSQGPPYRRQHPGSRGRGAGNRSGSPGAAGAEASSRAPMRRPHGARVLGGDLRGHGVADLLHEGHPFRRPSRERMVGLLASDSVDRRRPVGEPLHPGRCARSKASAICWAASSGFSGRPKSSQSTTSGPRRLPLRIQVETERALGIVDTTVGDRRRADGGSVRKADDRHRRTVRLDQRPAAYLRAWL